MEKSGRDRSGTHSSFALLTISVSCAWRSWRRSVVRCCRHASSLRTSLSRISRFLDKLQQPHARTFIPLILAHDGVIRTHSSSENDGMASAPHPSFIPILVRVFTRASIPIDCISAVTPLAVVAMLAVGVEVSVVGNLPAPATATRVIVTSIFP